MKQKNSIPRTIKFTCMTLLFNALCTQPLKGTNLQTTLGELTSALNGLTRTLTTSIPVLIPYTPTPTNTPTPMPVQPIPFIPQPSPSTPTTTTTNAFLSATLESKMPLCTSRDAINMWIQLDFSSDQNPKDSQKNLTKTFVESAQAYITVLKKHQTNGLSNDDIKEINRSRCAQSLESMVKSIEDAWLKANQQSKFFANHAQMLKELIEYEKSTKIYPPPS